MNAILALVIASASLSQLQNVITQELDDAALWEHTDGSITLVVVDDNGNPVSGATVACVQDNRFAPLAAYRTMQTGQTGADGICILSNLAMDRHFIHVEKDGHGWWGDDRVQPDDKHRRVTAIIGLYRSAKARVLDGRGQGLGGVQVFVNRGLPAAVTDAEGRFRIANLQHQMPVSLYKEGQVWIEVGVSPDSWLAEYMLPLGGRARLRVVGPDGNPLANCEVGHSSVRDDGSSTVIAATTNLDGYMTTSWLPLGRKLHASANFEADGTAYHGSVELDLLLGEMVEGELRLVPHWGYSVSPSAEGKQIKTYTRINPPPSARVSGRVVMAGLGEPVQARIAYDHSFEWVRRTKGHTEPDGRFLLEGVPFQRLYITAYPDDPALYCVGGLAQIDLTSQEDAKNLEFLVEKGCAIQGTVVSADDLPYQAQVSYSPDHGHYSSPVFTDGDTGAFRILNLPPPDDGYYKLSVSFERADTVSMRVGPLEPGTSVKNIIIRSNALQLGKRPLSTVKGMVVDQNGNPVSGAQVELPSEFGKEPAVSDDAGRFRLAYHTAGMAEITVKREARVAVLGLSDTLYDECAVIEGGSLLLPEEEPADEARIVVRVEPPRFVAGTIVDESGKPLDPGTMRWFGESATGTWYSETGKFLKTDFPPGRIALEFSEPGYRSVVLFSGRDFEISDTGVRVVMHSGPYPKFESIFKAVTGYDAEDRDRIVGGRQIWNHVSSYREWAGNDDRIWLVVQDVEGKPIQQIELGGRNPLFPSATEQSILTGGIPVSYRNEKGQYELPQESGFVSAPGFGTEWYAVRDRGQGTEASYLTLYPASTVTLHVVDAKGQPLPNARVFANKMEGGWPRTIDTPSPATLPDPSGRVKFDSLCPGKYEFFAADPASNASDRARLAVEPGIDYSVTIAVGN